MNRYASPIDLNNSNQSWTRLIEWAGTGKQVLDVGCGRGQIGRILNAQFGCTVTGIEINPDFARECVGYHNIMLGSAEDATLLSSITERFDVIICGDVLEHLRQPEIPLRALRTLLAPGGRLLISVPNVAQIRIRLMLLRGQWTYASEGIMDATHLRWFTLKTLRQLVTACGWHEEALDFTLGPNFVRYLTRLHLRKTWLPPTLLAAQLLLNLSAT
ncbi:MAG: class I SAM-dependent methyltransferase [Chloroflexi bacterium]|nr:class I SAM-dependent methyltransferase [Chloroflexota bacterium]